MRTVSVLEKETQSTVEKTVNAKELEKRWIKSMTGCFKVEFKFVETFAPDEQYQYGDRYFENAKEYTFIIEETEDKISIQHVLLVVHKNKELQLDKNIIIKHWRQDWIYENREFLSYIKDNEWEKKYLDEEEVQGTWTQKVYQVDDSPRYEGYGRWIYQDGVAYWDSETDAPLPRRELTKRNDYNVLHRRCRVKIFEEGGWEMEQDNQKILRDEQGKDTLICMEKGLETFTPDNMDTERYERWWSDRQQFWADVRKEWEAFYASNDIVKVNVKVGKDIIFSSLFGLAEKFSASAYDNNKSKEAIMAVLKKHVADYK